MTAPRRTQEERRAEAEHRLVQAAAELVGEIGPSKVTLANVGERAGYSRGLATHHFGSKGALMHRLVDAVTAQFRDAVIDERSSESLVDEVLGLTRAYFRIMTEPPALNRARLMLWADAVATPSADVRPAVVAADREFREEIEKRLERAILAGHAPTSVDPAGLATAIVALLRGVALQSMLDDQVDLDAARAEVEALIVNRIGGYQS